MLDRLRGPRRRRMLALFVGALAAAGVYFYVGQVQRAAQPSGARANVVVAKADLPARTALRADLLEVRQVPAESVQARAIRAPSEVSGKMLLVPVLRGEQLLTDKVGDASALQANTLAARVPPGHRALGVSFAEVIGSGGLIVPGDHVDVIATFESKVLGREQAMIIMQDVLVLAVAQSTSPEELAPAGARTTRAAAPARGGVPVPAVGAGAVQAAAPVAEPTSGPVPSAPRARSVTLAVRPEAAQRLALAESLGQLRYALRPTGEREVVSVVPADMGTIRSPLRPAAAEIVAVNLSPINARVGGTITLRVTVKNTSDQPMYTQEPPPGFTYLQGQTYFSQGYAAEPGTWRVAVGTSGRDATELPYRWGLGADLPPGATTSIHGDITVTEPFSATNFWAALIEEPGRIVQNGAGMTVITALPENIAIVAVDTANARSEPSVSAGVVAQVRFGTELQVMGQDGDWFRVRLPDGREAWVASGWVVSGR